MGGLASAEKQAKSVTKALSKNGDVKSLGTIRNYTQALTKVAEYCKQNSKEIPSLRQITVEQAKNYLEMRASEVGQKTLDMERQSIQKMMQCVTSQLGENERLEVTKSNMEQNLSSRMYTPEQVNIVSSHQSDKHALATQIAYASGLRAHELLTLRPASERPMDIRPQTDFKFQHREGIKYTVHGKGGLVREVIVPNELAQRLESTRFESPKSTTDRGIKYEQHYNIGGGKQFSDSFSKASKEHLGWTAGAHGLRHSYAQERMSELQMEHTRSVALETVSQELGHFRPEITEVYLR